MLTHLRRKAVPIITWLLALIVAALVLLMFGGLRPDYFLFSFGMFWGFVAGITHADE